MTASLEGSEWSAARPGRTSPQKKDPVPILQEVGCAPGPVWTDGKSCPHRVSIPDLPARSRLLCRLSYPVPLYIYIYIYDFKNWDLIQYLALLYTIYLAQLYTIHFTYFTLLDWIWFFLDPNMSPNYRNRHYQLIWWQFICLVTVSFIEGFRLYLNTMRS